MGEETKYQYLFNKIAYPILIIDKETYRIIGCNQSAEIQYGYSKDELLSMMIFKLHFQKDINCIKFILDSENSKPQYFKHITKDGSLLEVQIQADSMDYEEKKALILSIRVISNQDVKADKLSEATNLLDIIFNNTPMLIAYLDPHFNFLRVNKAYALADSKDTSYFTGKNHFDLYPDTNNEKIFRNVLETGKPYFIFGKQFVYANNPERGITYWDWSLVPIKDRSGKVTELVLTLLNATEREKAKAELIFRIRCEKIISSISSRFIIFLPRNWTNVSTKS